MAIGTVVLTPGSAYAISDAPVLDLADSIVDAEQWTPRVALDIHVAQPAAPLLLVCTGPACTEAPALGFAQRSARRAVAGYVLVDPVLPRPGAAPDWPDAPVTVVVTPHADEDCRSQALGARLRGWDVIDGDAAEVIGRLAAAP